jgi:hypothetical protein
MNVSWAFARHICKNAACLKGNQLSLLFLLMKTRNLKTKKVRKPSVNATLGGLPRSRKLVESTVTPPSRVDSSIHST